MHPPPAAGIVGIEANPEFGKCCPQEADRGIDVPHEEVSVFKPNSHTIVLQTVRQRRSREEQPTSADAVNEALHPTRTSPYSGKELRMVRRRQAGAGVEFVILCSGISPIKQELQGFKALQGSREQVGS